MLLALYSLWGYSHHTNRPLTGIEPVFQFFISILKYKQKGGNRRKSGGCSQEGRISPRPTWRPLSHDRPTTTHLFPASSQISQYSVNFYNSPIPELQLSEITSRHSFVATIIPHGRLKLRDQETRVTIWPTQDQSKQHERVNNSEGQFNLRQVFR